MHIEVIGHYVVVLEAFRNLRSTGWMPFVTIYRHRSACSHNLCVMQRRQINTALLAGNHDQAIDAARLFARQRIARGDLGQRH